MKILPETRSGNWSVRLAAIFILGYILTFLAAQFLYVFMGMIQVYLGIVIGVIGASSGVIGMISLFKYHERSPLVFISLAVGLYGLVFLGFLVWLTFFGGNLFSLGSF